MKVTCEYCCNEVERGDGYCPSCGSRLPKKNRLRPPVLAAWRKIRRRAIAAAAGILALALVVSAVMGTLRCMGIIVPEAGATSTYEQLLKTTPVKVVKSNRMIKFLEKIFEKTMASITWEDIARVKYILYNGQQLDYSFIPESACDNPLEFRNTTTTLQAGRLGDEGFIEELGYFIGAEEMFIALYDLRPEALASIPTLRSLRISGSGALPDMEELGQVEELIVTGFDIGNCSSLSGMGGLESLILQSVEYHSLAPLAKLPSLKKLGLDMQMNKAWDMDHVAEISHLEELDIDASGMASLSPITQLSGLKKLTLSRSTESDLSFLAELPELRELNLWNCPYLEDASFIADIPSLRALNTGADGLPSIAFLYEMPYLESLVISDASNCAFLDKMPELKSLCLQNSDIGKTYDFGSLTKLEYLCIQTVPDSTLDDEEGFAGIAKLKNLKTAAISNTGFTYPIDPLISLPSLESLSIYNGSYTFEPTRISKNLKSLTLSRADDLQALTPQITGMPKLERLSLPKCSLSDVVFLKNMPNLQYLNLADNHISDLSPVRRLKGLKQLKISNNPLTADKVREALPDGAEII